ncbi:MAG: magnesium/cobalt transporter CorA [Planctomycetes bacterium]|nr:magnesium/cobalt transporter CorA [Planctomycetota bacterium]
MNLSVRIPKLHIRRRKRPAPGSAPGTVAVAPELPSSTIRLFEYNDQKLEEKEIKDLSEIENFLAGKSPETVAWIDVQGLGDGEALRRIANALGLHPLTLEDIAHIDQRPKIEDFNDYLFIVLRMICLLAGGQLDNEQVSMIIKDGLLATFQEKPGGDCFDPVRRRLREGKGFARKSRADYLAYALLDAIIDNYFPVIDLYSATMDNLDEEILAKPSRRAINSIYSLKDEVHKLRRAIRPVRDVVVTLRRIENDLISESVRVALRDCYDHILQVSEHLENQREISSDLVYVYLSSVNEKTNEIIKVLTMITTIFIPLTFLVGVYGMNFDTKLPYNMPELRWAYGYPAFWALSGMLVVGMLFYFRRKGWLGEENEVKVRKRRKKGSNGPAPPKP